jgi:hypothetical protein
MEGLGDIWEEKQSEFGNNCIRLFLVSVQQCDLLKPETPEKRHGSRDQTGRWVLKRF